MAKEVAGNANVREMPPMMGGGRLYLHAGGAAGRVHLLRQWRQPGLHHPAYNFNDEAIVYGTSYWIKLVGNTLAV